MMSEEQKKENIKQDEKDQKVGLDVSKGEDQRKIMDAYKKSLRNRVFAPFMGTQSQNPIDLIKEEARKRDQDSTKQKVEFNEIDFLYERIDKLKKDIKTALLLSKISISIVITLVVLILIFIYGQSVIPH